MYTKRIRIFILLSVAALSVCIIRLANMQLVSESMIQESIQELKEQRGHSRQLKTTRGVILDRNSNVLATDLLQFKAHIHYGLSSVLDRRVRRYRLLKAEDRMTEMEKIDAEREELEQIIVKCAQFKSVLPEVIRDEIRNINDKIWGIRIMRAWRKNFPNSEIFSDYDNPLSVPLSRVIEDFENREPNEIRRIKMVGSVDILEMHQSWPLMAFDTEDDVFAAQVEFMDVKGLDIIPETRRVYPYDSVAAQTIGWVGLPQKRDIEFFEDDKLLRYQAGEICGREDGVEYVCEALLRGKRGEVFYDIDGEKVTKAQTQFGQDVILTIDIALQKRIEDYILDCGLNLENCNAPTSAVVLDVPSGDILAMVSLPTYDLNRVRSDYGDFLNDPNKPLINRSINALYPPGSVIKPLIAIIGLEEGLISPHEVISCPPKAPPKGWPRCWIQKNHSWRGHDDMWANHARNAIKGSCNIYFSRLAHRIDAEVLQGWLYDFGYGHEVDLSPRALSESQYRRDFRQASGIISSMTSDDPNDLPSIEEGEKRYFGMGQGNCRVTPLQVANSMAIIARGGLCIKPRLFIEPKRETDIFASVILDISQENLDVVRDGMYAVVNEYEGTANKEFAPVLSSFSQQQIDVYGKTGSTEKPEHAWFSGFVEDSHGRSLALAVLVEGGEHGSEDAAPLAREIIQFCIEAGYIGLSR